MDGHTAGDVIPFEEWLDTFQLAVKTPSSPGTPMRLSKREFVLIWAQQHGGAHEDWTLDERFQASRDVGLSLMGRPANDHALLEIAGVVLNRAEGLLAYLTPERIAQAERNLQRQR